LLLVGPQAVSLENAAPRLQLATFKKRRRPRVLMTFDRLFCIVLPCASKINQNHIANIREAVFHLPS
jgi:hypothetical protein